MRPWTTPTPCSTTPDVDKKTRGNQKGSDQQKANEKELQAIAAVLTLGGASLVAGTASAVTVPTTSVSVNSVSYNITYFTGSYDDNISKFTSTEMPWFGDATLASTFAVAVGASLGTPNTDVFGNYGPSFAWRVMPDPNSGSLRLDVKAILGTGVINTGGFSSESRSYAILAPSAPAPVPAPLPIFGAAAAFGATKRLRGWSRRLHRSTTELS